MDLVNIVTSNLGKDINVVSDGREKLEMQLSEDGYLKRKVNILPGWAPEIDLEEGVRIMIDWM